MRKVFFSILILLAVTSCIRKEIIVEIPVHDTVLNTKTDTLIILDAAVQYISEDEDAIRSLLMENVELIESLRKCTKKLAKKSKVTVKVKGDNGQVTIIPGDVEGDQDINPVLEDSSKEDVVTKDKSKEVTKDKTDNSHKEKTTKGGCWWGFILGIVLGASVTYYLKRKVFRDGQFKPDSL